VARMLPEPTAGPPRAEHGWPAARLAAAAALLLVLAAAASWWGLASEGAGPGLAETTPACAVSDGP